jgi:hypothetical protein
VFAGAELSLVLCAIEQAPPPEKYGELHRAAGYEASGGHWRIKIRLQVTNNQLNSLVFSL